MVAFFILFVLYAITLGTTCSESPHLFDAFVAALQEEAPLCPIPLHPYRQGLDGCGLQLHPTIYAGFYNWILHSQLGIIHFWIFWIGVNIVFLPMHGLGLAGMPRRIPDYPTS